MSELLQNILVLIAVIGAVVFLIKSFFFKKPQSEKACGTNKDCGCS